MMRLISDEDRRSAHGGAEVLDQVGELAELLECVDDAGGTGRLADDEAPGVGGPAARDRVRGRQAAGRGGQEGVAEPAGLRPFLVTPPPPAPDPSRSSHY